jgi:tetratricopeptide (TPR) repeat protein
MPISTTMTIAMMMMKIMSLSLCMIVKDEEATLADCLESVRDVVDEMVIGDTGSHDRTVEIAQSFGATVHSIPWENDFSAARNQVLQQIHSDWVLVLDADEVLLPEIVPQLRQLMAQDDCLVVNLVRQELGVRQVPYSLVSRFFRRHPAIAFSRPYHESIDDSVLRLQSQEPDWKVIELAGIALRHTGYTEEAIANRHKAERTQAILEGYLATHADDPYVCNKLGALYLDLDFVKGLDLLRHGLEADSIDPATRYELNYHLGCAYSQTRVFALAEKHFQAAIEQPVSAYLKLGAYTNWGNMRMEQSNPIAAQVLFQKAVEVDPGFALGYCNLGTALKAIGNLEDAIACYQHAIELEPTYAAAHQGLATALMKGGQVLSSLDAFRRAIALYRAQGNSEGDRLQRTLTEMKLL